MPLADAIDALLPQTQCTRCGYPACRPYAEAIARGEADINRCPPGGATGIEALATLLRREPKPLDSDCGIEQPPRVALIDEALCIGCTKCIQACPVDAIVGTTKRMHTVLADECSGCDLCLAPCPVDCIAMVPAPAARPTRERADRFRRRYQARRTRLEREARDAQQRLAAATAEALDPATVDPIGAAIARAKARRAAAGGSAR
jgi:electron transport complex protein RnfB